MSCESIKQQIADLKSSVNSNASAFRNVKTEINGISTLAAGAAITSEIQRAQSIANNMRTIIQLANNDATTARNLSNQAKAQGCGLDVSGQALDVLGLADTIISNALPAVQDAERKINTLQQNLNKEQAAASAAASKQNNAGTGTPGTAGTGPGASADDLQEVGVTGKKTPTPVDPLQEVTVTSQRTDALNEVSVTGKRNPDALEEVQVTGQTKLEEVQVTSKKTNTNTGVAPQIKKAQAQATLQDTTNFGEQKDWRVRLALSPGANYLYKAANPGILKYLNDSEGVIFPYTPTINVNYAANYQQTSVVHSNYKILQYENSAVDSISISCDFTAQDTFEANYLLAVIHFFRAATKMFYGQDENPKPGTPPPLVFLFGMGQFQFNAHPLVITSFSYNLPADVDYIRAGVAGPAAGANAALAQSPQKSLTLGGILQNKIQNKISSGIAKIGNRIGLNLTVGGGLGAPTFGPSFNALNPVSVSEPTYVPTKINLSISCMPIISRNNVSNNFSFKDYASGKLLQGVRNPSGGFW